MSFLYPAFLWALLALAIPVLIHLFNLRRTRRVYFSDIRILKHVREASQRMQHIRNILILISRILFLFFLVLAFAQPILSAESKSAMSTSVVIYLDNSQSMSVPMTDQTRLIDKAMALIQTICDLYPRGTRFSLLTNDFNVPAGHYYAAEEMGQQVSAVKLSPISRTFSEVIKRTESAPRKDFYYLSDFQQSTLGEIKTNDSLININLVPLTAAGVSNIYIDSVAWNSPQLIRGDRAKLTVWLRNDGAAESRQANLKLLVGGTLASVTNQDLAPGTIIPVTIDVSVPQQPAELMLMLDDFPASFDNNFYLTLTPSYKQNIVHVYHEKPEHYFESVFGNKSQFSFMAINHEQMDYRAIERADFIIIDQIQKLDAALIQLIKERKDIPILIIPPDRPDLKAFSSLFGKQIRLSTATETQPLEIPDADDPFFDHVFEEKSNAMQMPSCLPVITWNPSRADLLKFKDQTPFLSETENLFLMAGPVAFRNIGLAMHALFVPVMYRMAFKSVVEAQRPYYYLNQGGIVLTLDSLVENNLIRLIGNQEIVPFQRVVDGNIFLEIPSSSVSAGHYKVIYGTDSLRRLALNQNRLESQLKPLSVAELKNLTQTSNNITVFDAETTRTFSNEIKERYLGVPLWKYCLVLALMFLIVEMLLIRFFKSKTKMQPEPVKQNAKPDQLI